MSGQRNFYSAVFLSPSPDGTKTFVSASPPTKTSLRSVRSIFRVGGLFFLVAGRNDFEFQRSPRESSGLRIQFVWGHPERCRDAVAGRAAANPVVLTRFKYESLCLWQRLFRCGAAKNVRAGAGFNCELRFAFAFVSCYLCFTDIL